MVTQVGILTTKRQDQLLLLLKELPQSVQFRDGASVAMSAM
jgi:hypothetical protein